MRVFHYLLFLLLLVSVIRVDAAHIVGGDVNYTFISYNADSTRVTLEFEFNMYRDEFSGGAPFDDTAAFGIFRERADGSWENIDIVNYSPGTVVRIPSIDNPCIQEPTDVGTEATSYTFQYTFLVINRQYQVAYQRCCRNNSISNIFNPGETGAAFAITISSEAQKNSNSSPRFNDFPPLFLCANDDFEFDDSATDPDGDVIRYSFCAPSVAGGDFDAMSEMSLGCCDCVRPEASMCPPPFQTVSFMPPFTATRPLGGNPIVEIDNITGIISGTPNTIGQYVVGVCAEEYRNGVLIGRLQRDFQFNIIGCVSNVFADFNYEAIAPPTPDSRCKSFLINSCGENVVSVENDSRLASEIFSYHWTFLNPDGSVLDEIIGGAEVRDVDITFPGIGQYEGNMILNEGTECADSACFTVNIFPDITADFTFDYDTCVAGSIFFTNLSETGAAGGIISHEWDFNGESSSDLIEPSNFFLTPGVKNVTLTVTDTNGCEESISKEIQYFPVPPTILVEPTSFLGCTPADIFFDNLSTPIDSTYDIVWDFGDGGTSPDISPRYTYEDAGVYSVSVSITSPIGCSIEKSFDSFITVLDSPEADFSFSPEEPNNFTEEVVFTDLSTDAAGWQWLFDDAGSSLNQNPTYAFPDTGVYNVSLIVFHPITNCPDTIVKVVDVKPLSTLFMPNAFTPNNDGNNDVFKGKGFVDAIVDYTMNIYDRWGKVIFTTDDPNVGWNGQIDNAGAQSPLGVYVYRVSYLEPRGNERILEGHVTLVR